MQRRPHAPLRLGSERTELLICLHYVRVCEASTCELFWQSFVRLPRIGRKAKRDPAPTFHHPTHFPQSSRGIGPDLHRVDRQRLVKAVVIEWQTLNGTMPQVDTTALDSAGVPSPSLFDHLQRLINTGDMPRCNQVRQALNNHTGSETDFQNSIALSDLKETNNPGAATSIHARHDDAAQPSQDALRAAKHAHQNILHDTCRASRRTPMPRGDGINNTRSSVTCRLGDDNINILTSCCCRGWFRFGQIASIYPFPRACPLVPNSGCIAALPRTDAKGDQFGQTDGAVVVASRSTGVGRDVP